MPRKQGTNGRVAEPRFPYCTGLVVVLCDEARLRWLGVSATDGPEVAGARSGWVVIRTPYRIRTNSVL